MASRAAVIRVLSAGSGSGAGDRLLGSGATRGARCSRGPSPGRSTAAVTAPAGFSVKAKRSPRAAGPGERHELGVEPLVATAVTEAQGPSAPAHPDAESAASLLLGDVLAGHGGGDDAVASTGEGFLDLDGEAGEIGRRGPEPGRRRFGVDVPAPAHRPPVAVIAG